MEQNEIRKLLQNVANGDISVDDALLHIKNVPFEDLGYAKPDFHRKMRQGVSEVIYGAGKTAEQIIGISKSFAKHGQKDILITRLDKTKAEKINKEIPLSLIHILVHICITDLKKILQSRNIKMQSEAIQ